MPSYKVLKPGFYAGELYDPEGKRPVLRTDKPFEKCPSWLAPMREESVNQRKRRKTAETKQAKVEAEKAVEDKKAIDSVTFTQPPSTAQVETL